MISIIITSYKEEKTIGAALEAILKNNLPEEYEILVMAPDTATLNVAREYSKRYKNIMAIKDKGEGKPSALNLAIGEARGKILVLTDGDVHIGESALKLLLEPFKSKKIGAVTGNPVSLNLKGKMMGYWAHILTNIAHQRRLKAMDNNKRFFCSGYLFAVRAELFPNLPVEMLSEDGFISHKIYEKGYKIAYSPQSKVYVKYPTNFKDWVLQKKRSAGGYSQIKKMIGVEIRSFKKESLGAYGLFKFVSTPKEFFWLNKLFLARIYLWYVINRDINSNKKSHKEIWQRVESTK